ncbi:MAG TPA: SRPBCC family protein [Chitinophagaceae bacterium]
MAVYSLKAVQKIPASLSEVWAVFSTPANLHRITPEEMKFKTISAPTNEKIHKGQVIEYRVSPLMGIPLYWMTEITVVEAETFFIDEQRKGPYALWRHQHFFKEIEGGVEMTDLIHYKNPLWVLGDLANALFIKRKLRQLFEYRFYKVEEIFDKWHELQFPNIQLL